MTKFSTDNVTITLPISGKEVVLRGFVTKRMEVATSSVFMKHSKVDLTQAMKGDSSGIDMISLNDLPGTAITELTETTITNFVISLDGNDFGGNKEDILNACYELPSKDFDAITDKCHVITKGTSFDEEKKRP